MAAFMRAKATAAFGLAELRFVAAPPRGKAAVFGLFGRKARCVRAGAPRVLNAADEIFECLASHDPGVEMRVGAIQDERARAAGISGREQNRHGSAFRGAKQGGALAADRIHHRAQVIHARFQRREMVCIDAITQAGPALVEHDQARERGEPGHQMAEAGIFPVRIEIGNESGNENQIERSVADDLIGNADVAALGVTRFWKCHRPTVRHDASVHAAAYATGG